MTTHQDTSTERFIGLDGGKYTVKTDGINIEILRYGEPWRNHTGDKMFSCLLDLVFDQQAALASRDEAAHQHPDDEAVDTFAARMKWKLARARAKGRSGWQDRAWSPEAISQALREHVEKGDPTDVANYCMFLAARNEPIYPAAQQPQVQAVSDELIMQMSDAAGVTFADDDDGKHPSAVREDRCMKSRVIALVRDILALRDKP